MHSLLLTILTALRALRRNILRSALTCLGIVIAVAAVLAMAEIGNGSNSEIEKSIANMGAAMLVVFPSAANNSGINQGAGTAISLTPEDCQIMLRECPAVRNVAPMVGSWGQLARGSKNWQAGSTVGSSPAYFDVRHWDFTEGTSFTDEDVANSNSVCVIGQTVAENLFEDESPVGKELRLKNVMLRVVGVLDYKGSNVFGSDQDDIIVTPWTTMKYRVNGGGGTPSGHVATTVASTTSRLATFPVNTTATYPAAAPTAAMDTPVNIRFSNINWVMVSARSLEEIPQAIEEITSLLRDRHHHGDRSYNQEQLRH